MNKIILIILVTIMIFLFSHITYADCVDVSSVTAWSRVNAHTIIIYVGETPLALLKLPYCYIYSTSEIKFIKDYICNWDQMIVDEEVCDIKEVKRL